MQITARTTAISAALLAASTLLSPLAAQPYPLAYPDSATDTYAGNVVPFGARPSAAQFFSTRTQIRIPARFLPSGPSTLMGLEVLPRETTNMTYRSLVITVAQIPSNATVSSTFSANLQNAQVALAWSNRLVVHAAEQWTRYPFLGAVPCDGVSDLLIDVRKDVDPLGITGNGTSMARTAFPERVDLPRMNYAFSSQATGSAVSGSTIKVRLLFDSPVMDVWSPRPSSGGDRFAIGGIVRCVLRGPPRAPYAILLSLGAAPTPLTLPTIDGAIRLDLTAVATLASGTLATSLGIASVDVTIPSDPGLVGLRPMFQGYWLGAGRITMTTSPTFLIGQ